MDFDWLLTATMTETLFLRVELFGAGFLSGSIPYGLLIARFLGKEARMFNKFKMSSAFLLAEPSPTRS